ncbi:uncharacterized protein LOC105252748 isoform X2 [Camponotus floridanus]|uniref:uncharacterized protein LOC105252748 isoform X2 n=1 Tax=Camponotus floridanus TaxID=104421 RepID=UPI000DC68188|nr:uncharacterized protein LOC105252748 isoform X2 [Camponotus floridanus]
MDTIEVNDLKKQATTDALVIRYRTYSRRVRTMLYLGGVLQDRTHSVIRTYIIGFLVILMCLSHSIFLLNFSRDYADNLTLMVKCFGQMSSFIAPALMSACFLIKREKLLELHETLNDLFERELEQDQETTLAILHAFDRQSYIMFFITTSLILSHVCPPLIFIIYQSVRHIEPKGYRLPFLAKFPWIVPINGGFLFYLHFLYHFFIGWWVIFTINSVDSLFGFYAFQISSILHAMSIKLRSNLRSREVLKICIQIHGRLLQCSYILEDIWQLIILRMLVTNACVICALIFEASQFTDITMNEVFSFIFFIALKLLQTFIYAWNGSSITSASKSFFRANIFAREFILAIGRILVSIII